MVYAFSTESGNILIVEALTRDLGKEILQHNGYKPLEPEAMGKIMVIMPGELGPGFYCFVATVVL